MTNKGSWSEKDIEEAFFPVALRPVLVELSDRPNEYKRLRRHFAVMDLERKYPFAVVTENYELVTNKMAYEMSAKAMEKVFQVTKLDDLACFNVTMPKTRSFCHIDLIHLSADFSPWENDTWTAFLRITNSYNRTRRLRFELGFCRWICLNGMIFGAKSIEFSYAHTVRSMPASHRFSDNIGDIRRLEAQLIEQLHHLKRFYVPKQEMMPLFCRVFGIDVRKSTLADSSRHPRRRLMKNRIIELTDKYFDAMGPHGYAALNVLTDFATRPAGVISPEASMNGFQQRAGAWVNEFICEISQPSFSFDTYLGDYRESARLLAEM